MPIKVRRYAGLRRAPIFTRSSLPIHRFSDPWPFRSFSRNLLSSLPSSSGTTGNRPRLKVRVHLMT